MGGFEDAFASIEKAVKDMATLEVISYKGRIELTADEIKDADFGTIIAKCTADADLRVMACTRSHLDGDMKAFYDKEATEADLDAHLALVETARESREALVDFFREAVGGAVGRLGK